MTAHMERPASDVDGAEPVPTDSAATMIAAFGGVRGMIDMTVPGLVFVIAYTISRSTWAAAITAGAVALAFAIVRIVRRESLQHALGGFLGVAVAGFVAIKSGKAENFYSVGMLLTGGYAVAYLISILVRWPLIGVVLGPALGENFTWRQIPARYAAYRKATWVWIVMFVLRIVIQIPIWMTGNVTALGAAKVALGVPPFLVVCYITWLIMSKAPPPVKVADLEDDIEDGLHDGVEGGPDGSRDGVAGSRD
ncbi:DUF3159 domain-containing protein [Streptomyces sp. SID3343]|uniref:DUF3159 domain-containing protein n=1 Tax=Streptomyces sp. SID3343 TaxID=2690260 RepID=UPI00136CD2EA|nr:DUF3159 domain-containing protein [Streptomyces sp. SID3343]